jgi:hypothetical protein
MLNNKKIIEMNRDVEEKLVCQELFLKLFSADSCEHDKELPGFVKGGNFFIFRATISFSRRTLLHGVRNRLLQ